jgi:hypothetical protein
MSLAGTYEGLVANYIIFAIMIAIFLKLLKLGKLSSAVFNSIVFIPFLLLIPFLIFAITYGLLSPVVDSDSTKFYFSGAITLGLLLIYLASSLDPTGYLKDFTLIEKIKIRFDSIKEQINSYFQKYFSSYADSQIRGEYTQMFAIWDTAIKKESEDKFWHLLLAAIFYVCTYLLLMDQEFFEDFIDSLSVLQKYTLLISLLSLFIFLYNLYYVRHSKIIFSKLIDLVSFLEKEKKYVLIVDNPIRKGTYNYVIVKYHPWKNRGKTNYYFFTHTKEMDHAYWINSGLDFRHYKNLTGKLSRHGVEGFLDLVISKLDKKDK